jgi:hypothetical protein
VVLAWSYIQIDSFYLFLCSAVEEITTLGRSIRQRYFEMDATIEPPESSARIKGSGTSRDASKRPKSRGRKARVAPIASDSQHGGSENVVPNREIEMVGMEGRKDRGAGSSLGGVDEESPLHTSANIRDAENTQDENAVETTISNNAREEVEGDTVALIGGGESAPEIRLSGKTVVADILRFVFLGIPG